jgi:hypothetical protein
MDNAITSTPSPILAKRDVFEADGADIPAAIRSIPINRRTIERNITIVAIADAGDLNAPTDSPIAIRPKTICKIRYQPGDLILELCIILLFSSLIAIKVFMDNLLSYQYNTINFIFINF